MEIAMHGLTNNRALYIDVKLARSISIPPRLWDQGLRLSRRAIPTQKLPILPDRPRYNNSWSGWDYRLGWALQFYGPYYSMGFEMLLLVRVLSIKYPIVVFS